MNNESERENLDYRAISVRLRAPRIAIVFPDREPWPFYAAISIHRASQILGGANFILVPHNDGDIDRSLLNLVTAYDPDHVVSIFHLLVELMMLDPANFTAMVDEKYVDSNYVAQNMPDHEVALSRFDEIAQQKVAAACTPFLLDSRDENYDSRRRLYSLEILRTGRTSDLVRVSPQDSSSKTFDFVDPATRSASIHLISQIGLAVAPSPTPQSALTEQEVIQHLQDIPSSSIGGQFGWANGEFWRASLQGLVPMSQSWLTEEATWLIVGSTATDFALAHNLSRIHGSSIWVPTEWLENNSPFNQVARKLIRDARFHYGHQEKVRLVTSSEDLESMRIKCLALGNLGMINADDSWLIATEISALKDFRWPNSILPIFNEHDKDMALPVIVNEHGDFHLVNDLPPLLPELTTDPYGNDLHWIIDTVFHNSFMPRGKNLSPRILETETRAWNERIRSGRDGTSIMSKSNGFLPAGATARRSVSRPCLSIPSLFTWVKTQARSSSVGMTISDAGQLSQISRTIWRNGEVMASDMYANQSFFREFLTETDKTTDRYPADDGCVIRSEGFLTFEGALRTLSHVGTPEEVRSTVDQFVNLGVLSRGLILQCPGCRLIQFLPGTGERLTCSRCTKEIPLNHRTWKKPVGEPRWYYDLHQVIRRLFRESGDVPILAAHHLRQKYLNLKALPEIEFEFPGARPREIDLIAGNTNRLIVGECKSTSSMTRKDEKKKIMSLVSSAKLLHADEVLLASGETGGWSPSIISNLRTALASESWPTGYSPRIHLMTGLRTANANSQIID